MNLFKAILSEGPAELVKVVRFGLLAPRYSALWESVQKELVEDELNNLPGCSGISHRNRTGGKPECTGSG